MIDISDQVKLRLGDMNVSVQAWTGDEPRQVALSSWYEGEDGLDTAMILSASEALQLAEALRKMAGHG